MVDVKAHRGRFRETRLHVDDTAGSGQPVVLIPVWPLSRQAWSPQIPALQDAGNRVITYDRVGFGSSDKPLNGYEYDDLAEDLHTLINALELDGVAIVGSSTGGGEVECYIPSFRDDRLHSEYAFYEEQMIEFFSANGELKVSEAQHQQAVALCKQASKEASLACMAAWTSTDFRDDLVQVSEPTLVIHGDADALVTFSARLTHDAIPGSELHVIADGPHGCNLTHADEFNEILLKFQAQ